MDIKPIDKRPLGAEKDSSTVSSAFETQPPEQPSFNALNNSPDIEIKEPRVPYLASLSAFVLLFIGTFYSLIGIVGYILDNTFVSRTTTDTEASFLSAYDFSSYFVIGEVSALIVSLPAVIALSFVLRKYESSEPWRLKQKLRRGIYSVGAIFLIMALVVSLTSTINGFLTTNIGLDYNSAFSTTPVKLDTGIENTKIALQGAFNVILLSAGLFALGSNYTGRRKNIIVIILAAVTLLSIALIPYTISKVNSTIKDRQVKVEQQAQQQKKAEQQREQEYQRLLNENQNSRDNNYQTDSFYDVNNDQSTKSPTSSDDMSSQL